MKDCGQWAYGLACRGCGTAGASAAVPAHCGVRGCPRCDRRRSALMQRFAPTLLASATPREPLKFLTLTLPSVPHLERDTFSRVSRCYRAFRKLLRKLVVCERVFTDEGGAPLLDEDGAERRCGRPRRPERCRSWCSGRKRACRTGRSRSSPPVAANGELCPGCDRVRLEWCDCAVPIPGSSAIKASLRSIEANWKDSGWNPHLHVVGLLPWTSQRLLAGAWTAATLAWWPAGPANSMGAIVKVVRGEGGIRELLKYPTKMAELCGKRHQLAEWFVAVRGKRLVQATGAWTKWSWLIDALDADELERAALEGETYLDGGAARWAEANAGDYHPDAAVAAPDDAWTRFHRARVAPCSGCGATDWATQTIREPARRKRE